MMGRLARETDEGKKIAVVLDNARFHHAMALTDLYAPGRALERITPIYMPPLRPRPWVPQNTCRTPPRTISPTPARSPRRTPSRPSAPTSPTAPSTTTSSTYQSHHPTPILFNFSHTFPTSTYLSPILLRSTPRRMGERYVHATKLRSRWGALSSAPVPAPFPLAGLGQGGLADGAGAVIIPGPLILDSSAILLGSDWERASVLDRAAVYGGLSAGM